MTSFSNNQSLFSVSSSERASFTNRGITLQETIENEELISNYPLLKEIRLQGMPLRTVLNFLFCGTTTGYLVKKCQCSEDIHPITVKCDLKTCPICSKRRKQRLKDRFFPYFFHTKKNRDHSLKLRFLTISPPNYVSLEYGLKHIRNSFLKFLRKSYRKGSRKLNKKTEYLRDRIKAGVYVIEVKQKPDLRWNIHLHAIIFSKYIDTSFRGHCLDCGQNLLKWDKKTKTYYCSSKKCLSSNVLVKTKSRLSDIWRDVTGMDAHFDVQEIRGGCPDTALNYCLKYMSSEKTDYQCLKSEAEFIRLTYQKRMINSFGDFYKEKFSD